MSEKERPPPEPPPRHPETWCPLKKMRCQRWECPWWIESDVDPFLPEESLRDRYKKGCCAMVDIARNLRKLTGGSVS